MFCSGDYGEVLYVEQCPKSGEIRIEIACSFIFISFFTFHTSLNSHRLSVVSNWPPLDFTVKPLNTPISLHYTWIKSILNVTNLKISCWCRTLYELFAIFQFSSHHRPSSWACGHRFHFEFALRRPLAPHSLLSTR